MRYHTTDSIPSLCRHVLMSFPPFHLGLKSDHDDAKDAKNYDTFVFSRGPTTVFCCHCDCDECLRLLQYLSMAREATGARTVVELSIIFLCFYFMQNSQDYEIKSDRFHYCVGLMQRASMYAQWGNPFRKSYIHGRHSSLHIVRLNLRVGHLGGVSSFSELSNRSLDSSSTVANVLDLERCKTWDGSSEASLRTMVMFSEPFCWSKAEMNCSSAIFGMSVQ